MANVIISNPTDSCVKIQEGEWFMICPKGSLTALSDESDRVSIKVSNSRKTIFGFHFSDSNIEGMDAWEVVQNLSSIFN